LCGALCVPPTSDAGDQHAPAAVVVLVAAAAAHVSRRHLILLVRKPRRNPAIRCVLRLRAARRGGHFPRFPITVAAGAPLRSSPVPSRAHAHATQCLIVCVCVCACAGRAWRWLFAGALAVVVMTSSPASAQTLTAVSTWWAGLAPGTSGCAPGSFYFRTSVQQRGVCTKCPVGTYQPRAGSFGCYECEVGESLWWRTVASRSPFRCLRRRCALYFSTSLRLCSWRGLACRCAV
jgi:hypothetical protein